MTVWNNPSGINTGWVKPADLTVSIETADLLQENGRQILQENGRTILSTFYSGFRKIAHQIINTIWN